MKFNNFKAKLDSGKTVHYGYERDGRSGLISVWRNGDSFVLTWEECEDGHQYDESEYSRDERREFDSPEAAFNYLVAHGITIDSWRDSREIHSGPPTPTAVS